MKWQDKLTTTERRHLRSMAMYTLEQVKYTLAEQKKQRDANGRNPVLEPCWICHGVAKKLGLEV